MQSSLRISLWNANGQRCLYCGEHIQFRNLEIDHLIPESTSSSDLEIVRAALGLPHDFTLQDPRNLIPTHNDCNRKKRDVMFPEESLRFYLGIWGSRQPRVHKEQVAFEAAAARDDVLAKLAHQIESGAILKHEVVALIDATPPVASPQPSPMTFVVGRAWETVSEAHHQVATIARTLRKTFRRPLVLAEPFQYDGESLSVRLAVWNLDVARLFQLDLSPWEVLEVEPADTIYGGDAVRKLADAIAETYNIFNAERDGCPQCGGTVVLVGMASEAGELGIGTCEECGWENYDG